MKEVDHEVHEVEQHPPAGRQTLDVVGVVTATVELVQRRPLVKLVYNGAVYALAAAAAGAAVAFVGTASSFAHLTVEVLVGATAFYVVDIPLVAAILARWSREPFLPVLRSSVVWTVATFAIMASVSLALVVLWHESPLFALALAGPLVAVALHQRSTHEALRAMRLALTDPLTGLGNHRHFQDQLQIRLEESSVAGTPVSVCLFDLDNFKQINDRYGHPAGDRVLAQVAARLRHFGEAFRLGGDEFALILPGQAADAAHQSFRRRRRTIIIARTKAAVAASSHQNSRGLPSPATPGSFTFMPNKPLITVNGTAIVVMIVSVFITSFSRFEVLARCASSRLVTRSWNTSASSLRRTSES